MTRTRKHTREVELIRELQEVLESLPYRVTVDLVDSIIAVAQAAEGKDKESSSYSRSMSTEFSHKGCSDRYDLVIPIGSLTPYAVRAVVLEAKIHSHHQSQLDRYCESLHENDSTKGSLLVSVAGHRNHEAFRLSGNGTPIVYLTWTDIFANLLSLLGSDGEVRILGTSSLRQKQPAFQIESNRHGIGRTAEVLTEKFLYRLVDSGLVEFRTDRIMVATGGVATDSTRNHDVYFYPKNRDHIFKYLAIVWGSKLQYIGKVDFRWDGESLIPDDTDAEFREIGDVLKDRNVHEPENEKVLPDDQRLTALKGLLGEDGPGSRSDKFVILSKIEQVPEDLAAKYQRHPQVDIGLLDALIAQANNGEGPLPEFKRKGPFTQRHRYFPDIVDFLLEFENLKG